ncbi:MAG: vWA domain-containing protein [Solirubrobacteraceae bacterium]
MPDRPVSERPVTGRQTAFAVQTIHLDLPVLVGALSQRLRTAGVAVTPERCAHLAHALTLIKPITRRRLYWTTRAVLVADSAQVKPFDAVFFSVFGGGDEHDRFEPEDVQTTAASSEDQPESIHETTTASPGVEAQPPVGTACSSPPGRADEVQSREVEVPVAIASTDELLGRKRFDALEPHELAQLYRLMTRLALATPLRRTRRTRKGRHGERIDMRRTLRASLRTGGDPVRLARRRRRVRRRRIVMLCDISGSMEPYARAYLQFLFLSCAAAGGPDAEAFAFATRLTRLTRALTGRDPEHAIQRAAATAPDWSSGTRIGDALKTFNDRHGRRGMARGAVIVILSDGWEREDPRLVGREMERLARLAYRIVWVNPRVGASGFAPRAGGLVAALPHCDALVSGHSLRALEQVAEAIGAQRGDDDPYTASWRLPSPPLESEEEEPWASATPVPGSSVAMPSGFGPSRGNTTPGWGADDRR